MKDDEKAMEFFKKADALVVYATEMIASGKTEDGLKVLISVADWMNMGLRVLEGDDKEYDVDRHTEEFRNAVWASYESSKAIWKAQQ